MKFLLLKNLFDINKIEKDNYANKTQTVVNFCLKKLELWCEYGV